MLKIIALHHDWAKSLYWYRPERKMLNVVLDAYCVALARLHARLLGK